jgi:hypothetical protein
VLRAAALMFLLPVAASASCAGSSPTWTTTPDSASVSTCISNAASGDTINISAGSGTWGTKTITKAIGLIGPGTANLSVSGTVDYEPTSAEAVKVFEMSGITFSGTQNHFTSSCASTATPITGLKIHDNAFDSQSTTSGKAIDLTGCEFGVFYNNELHGNYTSIYDGEGIGFAGMAIPHALGSANYPYFEDNSFGNGTSEFISETGQGGRLAFRHNTITGYACSGCEVHDIHGDQGSGTTISSEYYHNTEGVGASGTFRWMHHRGGQALVANNTISRNIGFNFTEYRSVGNGSVQAPANSCTAYPIILNSSYATCGANNETTCIESQVHNSYYWGNTAGGSSSTPDYTFGTGGSCGSDPPWGDNSFIQLNREFWEPAAGLESALPATCIAGANNFYGTTDTDKIFQCTSTNTWTLFYQPYTYPHPLRSSSCTPGSLASTCAGSTPQVATLSESLTTSATLSVQKSLHITISQSLSTSDALSPQKSLHIAVSQVLTTSDALSKATQAIVSESLSTSDSLAVMKSLHRAMADALSTATSLDSNSTGVRSVNLGDDLSTSDQLSWRLTLSRFVSQSLTTSDSLGVQFQSLSFSFNVGPKIFLLGSYGLASAGACGFDLQITGQGFTTSAVAQWNGSARPTVVHNSRWLTATLQDSDLASPGTAQVAVANAVNQISQPRYFWVLPDAPTISAVRLSRPSLIVDGFNFSSNTAAFWNGSALVTKWISSNRLQALPPQGTKAIGTNAVTVANIGCGSF